MHRASQSDNSGDEPRTASEEVALLVACLCAAVDKSVCYEAKDPQIPLALLLVHIYEEEKWRLPLETEMDAVARWSLHRMERKTTARAHSHPLSQGDDHAIVMEDIQRLIASATRDKMRQQLTGSLVRGQQFLEDAKKSTSVPAQFKMSRIEEDEREMRWGVAGEPQPLRRNILGERYATVYRPLAYLKRGTSSEIFQLMKPRVKEELHARERRRIARLNAQKQQHLGSGGGGGGGRNPEEALEAKLDRLLDAKKASVLVPDDPLEPTKSTTKIGADARCWAWRAPHFLADCSAGFDDRLFVETLSGAPLTLEVAADASVASVQQMIENVEFMSGFALVCAGKQLSSGSLADFGVEEADTLKMLYTVNGGMRAKWRKKRMRRLRRKRRKMRQRAR